jgi:predicted short-subunit dehydrogenase-like oxidoreductase (DUF2520 family)
MTRVGFVGAGRVAAALAEALHRAGVPVVAIASRDRRRATQVAERAGAAVVATPQEAADASDLIFLTVTDDAIEPVCRGIAWGPGRAVVHCSGATELTALQHARNAGALVGGFHPLQMFANPTVAVETLPGCTITIDAEPPLVDLLADLVRQIGCRPVRLPPGRRALYHASAYYVGPFLIALMHEAAGMWAALGVSERDMLDALVPLLNGTVAAVRDAGLAGGMGGCVARGDVGTVARHLEALGDFSADAEDLYRTLALRTIPLGIERGTLSHEAAAEIRALLESKRPS